MRLAVLSSPTSWYFRDLERAAGAEHELRCLPFTQLRSRVGGEDDWRSARYAAGEANLEEFDAVLVRSMPPGSLEQVVVRMDILGQLHMAGVPVVNPPKALEAAIDKYVTSIRLAAAGFLTPRTVICQGSDAACEAFHELGGDVVVKPLFGGEGRGITRISDEALALRCFSMLEQLGAVHYVQEFIPHDGCDWRLLVIGERVYGIRRVNPHDWRTNVSRGAHTEPLEVDGDLRELALQASAAIGAPLAGIDVLPGKDGRRYLIEVNAVPGWRALARTLNVDIARGVLDYIESQT